MTTATLRFRNLPPALLLGLALALPGCVADPSAPGVDTDPPDQEVDPSVAQPCFDYDRDGFGRNCERGPDCDDADPTRATECGVTRASDEPECEDGEVQGCYVVRSAGEDVLHCGRGTRDCEGGLWNYCALEEEFDLEAGQFASRTGPGECNPCDPACARVIDVPEDTDLTPDNSDGVEYDPGAGGITLDDPGTSAPVDSDGDGVPDRDDDFPTDPNRWTTADADGGIHIYHDLAFNGPTEFSPVQFDIALTQADVFFLMDTTGSMQGEIDNLRTSLTTGNFVLDPTLCGLPGGAIESWTAEYFPNRDLTDPPDFTRTETSINYEYGSGGPDNEDGTAIYRTNQFSVRWTGTLTVQNGPVDYTFTSTSDDGIRVFVDGVLVIDEWRDRSPTTDNAIRVVDDGDHEIVVEYYENSGGASVRFNAVADAPAEFQGLIGAIRCQIPDIAVGVGYFDDYPIGSYGYSQGDDACDNLVAGTEHDIPFHQLIGSTTVADAAGRTAVSDEVARLSAHCGGDNPEALVPALWSVATGGGLPDSRPGQYARPGLEFVPLLDDDYVYTNGTPYSGALTADRDLGDVTNQLIGIDGTTSGFTSRYDGHCGSRADAPDVIYRFQVTERKNYMFRVRTTFDTSFSLFRADGTSRIECISVARDASGQFNETLNPGEYIVVVDGTVPNDPAPFRMWVGEETGETLANPYQYGDLTNDSRFYIVDTDSRRNDVGNLPAWGGNSSSAEDIYFRFTLTDRTQIFGYAENSRFNSISRLYDGAGNLLFSVNGNSSESHLFAMLDPGVYTMMLEGSGGDDGEAEYILGAWPDPDAWITPPAAACAEENAFGYPCFREGTIPIVIAFTDQETHHAPDTRNRYANLPAPAYPDTLYALGEIGARFIGIHSGTGASQSCNTPCNEWSFVEQCDTEVFCAEFGPEYDDCTDTVVCAEFAPDTTECMDVDVCTEWTPRDVCWDQQVCQQGICWFEERCRTEWDCTMMETQEQCTPVPGACIRNETVTNCVTRQDCLRTDTRETNCRDVRDTCLDSGPTTCTTNFRRSEQHMRSIGVALNSVDGDGEPFVYQINSNGTDLSEAVVEAVNQLSNFSRLDVTLRVNDNDATVGVDERDFVASVAAVPTVESTQRCLRANATWFEQCLPGTDVRFEVGFRNDFIMPALTDQEFNFTIDILGDSSFELAVANVTIVVPAVAGFPGGRLVRGRVRRRRVLYGGQRVPDLDGPRVDRRHAERLADPLGRQHRRAPDRAGRRCREQLQHQQRQLAHRSRESI